MPETTDLKRTLGRWSAAALVSGSMIGSGIFLVASDVARLVDNPLVFMAIWVFAGLVTLMGAHSYGKLAGYMPQAGGQYVFLLKAWGEVPSFLYGWAFFWVIQTGFLAAVAVAFIRYLGILFPQWISTEPLLAGFSSEQLLACTTIIGLTIFNTTGIKNGALLQNIFTFLKVLALISLLVVGLIMGQQLGQIDWALAWQQVQSSTQTPQDTWAFMALVAVASVGPLFSSDAWNYVTFIGGEVKDAEKNLPWALTVGTITVIALYILVNLAYLNILPLTAIQQAPNDRIASEAFQYLMGAPGALAISLTILISTFACYCLWVFTPWPRTTYSLNYLPA